MPISPDDIPTRIELSRVSRISPLTGNTILLGEDDAAVVIAHHWPAIERHIREQVAQEIAATAAASKASEIDRPKFERGGFLNDWQWAEQVARGTNQPATEETPR